MATIISSKTSGVGGLTVTGDNSGVLQLASADGTTAVTIDASQNTTLVGTTTTANLTYTGTLTGSTGILNIGSGQVYKDASGNVGIGTSSPATWGKFAVVGASSGGQVVAAIANTSGTANTQAVLSFDTTNNGFNVRDSQIRATNNGSNLTTLEFYTSNAATPIERMRIDASGNLLVGTTSAVANARSTIAVPQGSSNEAPLGLVHGPYSHRIGPNSNGSFVVYRASDNVGQYQTYGATSWTSTSDERLKTDLIPIENGLDKVNSLRSVTGRFKTDEVGTSRSFLIAQDVQAVIPEAVSVQDDELGTLGVAYTEVIPLLVASIKELKAIIDTQATRITALEAK